MRRRPHCVRTGGQLSEFHRRVQARGCRTLVVCVRRGTPRLKCTAGRAAVYTTWSTTWASTWSYQQRGHKTWRGCSVGPPTCCCSRRCRCLCALVWPASGLNLIVYSSTSAIGHRNLTSEIGSGAGGGGRGALGRQRAAWQGVLCLESDSTPSPSWTASD